MSTFWIIVTVLYALAAIAAFAALLSFRNALEERGAPRVAPALRLGLLALVWPVSMAVWFGRTFAALASKSRAFKQTGDEAIKEMRERSRKFHEEQEAAYQAAKAESRERQDRMRAEQDERARRILNRENGKLN